MPYYIHKGLKKPLIMFGLKDKWLYYAMGTAVGGLIAVAVLSSIFGTIGTLAGAGVAGTGVWRIFKLQDKHGLYSKTKNHNEVHIITMRMSNEKIKKQ
jgi:hypothetical protein